MINNTSDSIYTIWLNSSCCNWCQCICSTCVTTGKHMELWGCVKKHIWHCHGYKYSPTHELWEHNTHSAVGVCRETQLKMQREPKHARHDQNPLLCALLMSRPPVRGAGREGWQTLVSALRGMPGEVRITHTKLTHTLTDLQYVWGRNDHLRLTNYVMAPSSQSSQSFYSLL